MKKNYFSLLVIILFSGILNAQKEVRIVFTEPVVTVEPKEWDQRSKLELKANYYFRNLGKETVKVTKDNFELPCSCSEIVIPQNLITTEAKDYVATYVYTIDPNKPSDKSEIEKLKKTNGKFSKVITFYIEGEDEVHELYFDGQIIFK
jgi:hypothetical protein